MRLTSDALKKNFLAFTDRCDEGKEKCTEYHMRLHLWHKLFNIKHKRAFISIKNVLQAFSLKATEAQTHLYSFSCNGSN